MTTLNALKSMVNYPLSEDNVLAIIVARDIDPKDEFDISVAQTREFQLAYADLLRFIVTMVNLQQGGSVTQAAVGELRGTANAIYKKYGEVLIGETADTRSTLQMVDWIC